MSSRIERQPLTQPSGSCEDPQPPGGLSLQPRQLRAWTVCYLPCSTGSQTHPRPPPPEPPPPHRLCTGVTHRALHV